LDHLEIDRMCQFNLDWLKIVKSESASEFDSLFPK
jgi:hypothetical protein